MAYNILATVSVVRRRVILLRNQLCRIYPLSILSIRWISGIVQRVALGLGLLSFSLPSDGSEFPGEVLLFPDVTAVKRFDLQQSSKLEEEELLPAINLFSTLDYGRFRFLGEWLLDTKSQELQRLQVGGRWQDTTFWLGRFHNPIGYWNTQFHHGGYLQTTASRPGIIVFEGSDGPLPTHLSGLLVEGIQEIGRAGLYYTLGVGVGPDLRKRLQPFDLLDPSGSYRPGATLRLAYQPTIYSVNEIGFSTSYTEIPGHSSSLQKVKQVIAGVFGNWQLKSVRILSEMLYVHNWLDQATGSTKDAFLNAYGQVEWGLGKDWTLFSRLEGTWGSDNDRYLMRFPNFVEDRVLGGVRYQLFRNMALKLEVSQEHLEDDRFGQVILQWSAVFP